ncbi:MAG: DsbE family thiol:disulfide interchange protein [Pseudomonadota bacterium]
MPIKKYTLKNSAFKNRTLVKHQQGAARWIVILPLLLCLGLFFILYIGMQTASRDLPSALVGKTLPNFLAQLLPVSSIETEAQSPIQSITGNDITGPALINVWATWCPTCRVEHAYLKQLSDQGVKIYGISYKDDPQAAQNFLQQFGNPFFLNILDSTGEIGMELGVYGAPETFVIDAERKIVGRHIGVVDERVWRDILQPLLNNNDGISVTNEF